MRLIWFLTVIVFMFCITAVLIHKPFVRVKTIVQFKPYPTKKSSGGQSDWH